MKPTYLLLLAVAAAPAYGQAGPTQQTEPARPDTVLKSTTSTLIGPRFTLSSARLFTPAAKPEVAAAQQEPATFDGWGARRSHGIAVAEVALINGFVWGYNEFIRQGNFTTQSPRSWVDNFKHGFEWDDNHFNNNQFAHPFHGNLYYNAARSSGLNFWESAPYAIGGSLMWECCGEIHRMAINDWIMTGLGGTAIGEVLYKLSSTVLDTEARGWGRFWREAGAFVLNPLRGFNRITSGRAWEVRPNPPERSATRVANRLMVGSRTVGEGRLRNNAQTGVFFETAFRFGDPMDAEKTGPFDWFTLGAQLNFGEEGKGALGRLNIRGNLYSKDTRRDESVTRRFAVMQNFTYWNNRAFEFGSMSFSSALMSRRNLSENSVLTLHGELQGILLGAVNSEYAFLAEVPNQEREREYDYGPGAGARLEGTINVRGTQVLYLGYQINWIHTLNGGDGDHLVHLAAIRAGVPIKGTFGLGADGIVFLRNSLYTQFTDVSQRVPQLRLYAQFDVR
jgi:hypothetical protein